MSAVKICIIDVDGTLTDGKIYVGNNGEIMKAFSVKDGYGVKLLQKHGIIPVIITGRKSDIIKLRAEELGITDICQGYDNKETALLEVCGKYNASFHEAAYIGDDMNDLECMSVCEICGCPADAAVQIKGVSDYVCAAKGGDGAVREFIEWLIRNKC